MLDLGKCLRFEKREFLQSQPKNDFAKTFSYFQVPAFRELCPSTVPYLSTRRPHLVWPCRLDQKRQNWLFLLSSRGPPGPRVEQGPPESCPPFCPNKQVKYPGVTSVPNWIWVLEFFIFDSLRWLISLSIGAKFPGNCWSFNWRNIDTKFLNVT